MTTTTDELLAKLRRLEWACARDEHAHEVAQTVRKRSHDLLNLVQVVDLASQQLVLRHGEATAELAADLHRAAAEAHSAVDGLAALGHAIEPHAVAHTLVAPIAKRVVTRGVVTVDDHTAVGWTAEEVELLLYALQLDAPEAELMVRRRRVEDGVLVEVVCGPIEAEALAVRMAMALARGAGGDVTLEPRGDGHEVVIAIAAR
jgi:hypothetical protein